MNRRPRECHSRALPTAPQPHVHALSLGHRIYKHPTDRPDATMRWASRQERTSSVCFKRRALDKLRFYSLLEIIIRTKTLKMLKGIADNE